MTEMSTPSQSKTDYTSVNLKYWDERAASHATTKEYAVHHLLTHPRALSAVVSFDLPLLGPLTGQRAIHLQCHIGTDTLSLARLGAAEVVGVDFSPAGIHQARTLASAAQGSGGEKLTFVQSDVYATPSALEAARAEAAREGSKGGPSAAGEYDLVYTGVGALCWIPSIVRWAEVVHALLRPGGRLFIREAHPVLWSLDEKRGDGVLALKYPYFETVEPEYSEADDDYVDRTEAERDGNGKKGGKYENVGMLNFNHGIGEMVTALLDVGMEIRVLREHESIPWCHISGAMRQVGDGEWTLKEGANRVPHSFTLVAVKREG